MAPTINSGNISTIDTINIIETINNNGNLTGDSASTISASSSTISSSSMSNATSDSSKSDATLAATAATTTTTSTTQLDANTNNDNNINNTNNQSLSSSASSSSSFSATKRTSSSNDVDLKSSIIEFMRERPFLWNNKHPSYKDHKRREQEFQEFSREINYPVQEIKRVWHVLRTNFFRAHKLLLERPHNTNNSHNSGENGGEKLWKYYLAMEYILEGTNVDFSTRANSSMNNMKIDTNNSSMNINDEAMIDDSCSSKETNATPTPTKQQRRSSKNSKSSLNVKRELIDNNNSIPNDLSNNNHFCRTARAYRRNMNDNNNVSPNVKHHKMKSSNGSIMSTMENDDDHLYARSLTATLKKFDSTTKEVIKLKFQEIIVEYMQKHQEMQNQRQDPSTGCVS